MFRVEWGTTAPLRIVSFIFSETVVKRVQKCYHSFRNNDINYKPSMKNVQSFHAIRFLTTIKFVPGGGGYLWGKKPPWVG